MSEIDDNSVTQGEGHAPAVVPVSSPVHAPAPIPRAAATVGQALRQAREELGLTHEDLERDLRIKKANLVAIEEGRIKDLPGVTYALGFIRTYAIRVGLDSYEIIARFKIETSALDSAPEIKVRAPVREGGVPPSVYVGVGVVLALAVWGGWYLLDGKHESVRTMVEDVPARLAALVQHKPAEPVMEGAGVSSVSALAPASKTATTVASSPTEASTVPQPAVIATPIYTPPLGQVYKPPGKSVEADLAGVPKPNVETAVPAPVQPEQTPTPSISASAPAATSKPPAPASAAPVASPAPAAVASAAVKPELSNSPTGNSPTGNSPTGNAPVGNSPVGNPTAALPSDPQVATKESADDDKGPDEAASAPATPPTPAEIHIAAPAPAAPPPADPSQSALNALPGTLTPPTQDGGAHSLSPSTMGKTAVAPKSTTPTSSTAKSEPTAAPTDTRIVLQGINVAWIQVRDGSKILTTRVLRSGGEWPVPNRPGITLFTGNAGGVQIKLDGVVIGTVGKYGEVRRDIELEPDQLRYNVIPPKSP